MTLSIIIPALNEAVALTRLALSLPPAEIIVADGGSVDETMPMAMNFGWQVVMAPRGRGTQMNAGARIARGEVLLFLHADTRLPRHAETLIEKALADATVCGGNFSLQFDGDTRAAACLTWLYPFLRWGGMCYGDSAIFIRRTAFEALGGYRDFPLFEDVDLFRRMKRHGKFVRLAAQAVTSSRRFEGRFLRTFAQWSCLQVLYWFGVSPHRLAQFYRSVR
ncbi:MAG: glycosyltransferase family 2 protein [Acidobacteria bacterium]|nr:glycosyltransferase family 2 protein [Acidobacteriota bacterium]